MTDQPRQFSIGDNVQHFTIADIAQENTAYRTVLWTGKHAQIVAMTIPPGEEIGAEVHQHGDQILTFISGTGRADLAGETHDIGPGDQCAVPAGTEHNFRNTGPEPLVLYTVYSPPEHAADAQFATKAEAERAEEIGADVPPQT